MKLRSLFLACMISVLGIGCQLTPTFTTGYQVDPGRLRSAPVPEKLAVVSFEEDRSERYYSSAGRLFMTYIPLIPYVSMPFERLEESIRIQSDDIQASGRGITRGAKQNVAPDFETYYYPNSFPAAIAEDLATAGLFDEVDYVGDGTTNGYRFVLSGTLHASPLRNTTTSFGLGMAGVLLWLLPVPMAKTTASLDLDLVLTDRQTGDVVWTRRLDQSIRRYYTLYTSSAMLYGRGGAFSFNLVPPPSDSKVDRHSLFSWHFEALRRAMLESRDEIAAALSARTASPE
jgi:hypothetical protein